MQQEAVPSLLIRGASNCRQFVSGCKFTLQRHFNADGGPYVLTSVSHSARLTSDYRSGDWGGFTYQNNFTCIPLALPFRPLRTTLKPTVQGSQTAVVVGPAGEEIFTDKYGRVKVQFHWDRDGQNDADSSCWVRVATPWAGKQWGMIHIPRIGQEVIVDFLEGDPDNPIIVVVEHDDDLKVGNDQTIEIKNNRTETVKQGNEKVTIEQGDRTVQISMGNETLLIKMGNQSTKLDLGKSETEAMQSIELKVGQSSVKLDQTGVTIQGMLIQIQGQIQTQVQGLMTQINGSAMVQVQGGIIMIG